MKKTQFIDVIRDIKKNIVSIVSIFVFVTLSVSIYFGISWYINTMNNNYDEYLAEGMVNNIEYYFAYGADEKDLAELKNVEGVDVAEGVYVAYGYAQVDGSSLISEFKTFDGQLNKIELIEGNYPQGENEVLIEQYSASDYDIKVGDIITVDREDTTQYYISNKFKQGVSVDELESIEEESKTKHYALKSTQYKVSGIVSSSTQTIFAERPYYYQNLQKTKITFFINKEALNLDNFLGYNKVYIYSQSLADMSVTSDEYSNAIEELSDKLDPVAEEINNKGFNAIENGYQNLLDDFSTQLNEASDSIAKGKEELTDAKNRYAEAVIEIAKAEEDLKNGKQQLDDGKIQLDEGKAELKSAYEQLSSSQETYNTSKTEFDAAKSQFDEIKSSLNNELYLSTNEREPVNSALINNVTQWVNNLLSVNNYDMSAQEIVEAIKNSDDTDVKKFINLCASIIKDQETDSNLYIYANNIVNNKNKISKDVTKLADYTRGIIVYTYIGNALEVINNNQDIFAETDLNSQNDSIKNFKNIYTLLSTYNYLISVNHELYNGSDVYGNKDGEEYFIKDVASVKEKLDPYEEELNNYDAQLKQAANKLSDGWTQYNENKALYEEKVAEYNTALAKYNDGVAKLAEAKVQLAEAEQKINDGEIQLADAEEKYAIGVEKYNQLEEKYNSIEEVDYIKVYKANMLSASVVSVVASICTKSRNSLVGMYFAIALLICYNVISRMINDAIRQIGTKKALGFRKSEIFLHYLLAISLVLVVSFIVGVLASFAIQFIICYTMRNTMQFPLNNYYYSILEALIMLLIYLLAFGLITYFSCSAIIKRTAISLLSNNSEVYRKKHFYQRFKVWNKLSLLSKTTINNCFNDHRRVFSTIVGISSCTILLISAITLGSNVSESFKIQYNDYYHFDTIVYYDTDNPNSKEIEDILNNKGINTLNLYSESIRVNVDGSNYSGNYFIYQSGEDISDFMTLKSSLDEPFNNKGIWVSAGLNTIKGLEVGDTISITSLTGENINGTISGFIDEHVANVGVYIDSDTYSKLSEKDYKPNILIFNKGDYSIKDIESLLTNVDGYVSIMDFVSFEYEINNLFILLTRVIEIIYFTASLILGIFVILNLLITLVEEKRREVIVLMINGYSYKQAKKYIYTDTIYLTIISIIIGVIIGNIIGIEMVKQMEEVYIFFIHTYNLTANIVAVTTTILLVFIMCHIALKRVDKFKLNEATQ